jgi:hypothetical protein
MAENIVPIVSVETYDRTAAVIVRPSSENRHKTMKSGELVENVVGRVCARVVGIGASLHERLKSSSVKAILRLDSRKLPDLGSNPYNTRKGY